jgi:rifampicin phosphotransferase
VADATVREVPEMIVKTLAGVLERRADPAAAVLEKAEALRARVPAQHLAAFDALLEEARFIWPLRDDRTVHTDYPAIGLARRVLLEIGRRLVLRERLQQRDHVVELAPAEVGPLLLEGRGPTSEDLAAAARRRETRTIADAPLNLGPPPSPPPPPEWMKPATARIARATAIFLDSLFYAPKAGPQDGARVLRGLPVSAGVVEGPARVVSGPADFARVQQGDVLVSRTTTPTYNVLLPLLAGVVTDRGGLLSHTAVVAREYGLPAVVGTNDATATIPDGARVRVDGGSGEVRVLA